MDTTKPQSTLTRRSFLAKSAFTAATIAGAGSLLNACGSNAGAVGNSGTLTIMGSNVEITPAYIQEFEKLNHGVKVTFLNFDQTRLNAMFAAGQPPDIIRGYGFDSAYNSDRGLALNLDPYLEKSTVLKKEDLMPIQDLWRWNGKQTGQGSYYGLAKDWSPDGTLWCNTELFTQRGITIPSTTTPLTFDEVLAMSKKLAVQQGGKIKIFGVDPGWPNGGSFGTQTIYQMVAQQGGRIFSSDMSKADFTTPEALKALQWYVDFAQSHSGPSPLDPDPDGWDGPTYQGKRLAASLYGYWFGGVATKGPADVAAHSLMLPAPQMGSTRISSCFAGTGLWISASSQQKDLAWKFFEYFYAGQPGHDRATSGWGVPTLKSLLPLLPHTTPTQQKAYDTLQEELKYFAVLPTSPYTTSTAVGTVLDQYLQQAAKGQLSVSNAAQQITTSVNLLLQQGQQTAG